MANTPPNNAIPRMTYKLVSHSSFRRIWIVVMGSKMKYDVSKIRTQSKIDSLTTQNCLGSSITLFDVIFIIPSDSQN